MTKRRLILFAALLAVFFGAAPHARAGALEDAESAYYNKFYDTAFKLFMPLAEQGVADAQNKIGWMYLYGYGTYRSYPDAIVWLTKAANQGIPEATHEVGQMYDMGLGVQQNKVLAYMWYLICKKQLDGMDPKPLDYQDYDPVVDMNVMYAFMSKKDIDQAKQLASGWKKLLPSGKVAPPPKAKPSEDQYPLPAAP